MENIKLSEIADLLRESEQEVEARLSNLNLIVRSTKEGKTVNAKNLFSHLFNLGETGLQDVPVNKAADALKVDPRTLRANFKKQNIEDYHDHLGRKSFPIVDILRFVNNKPKQTGVKSYSKADSPKRKTKNTDPDTEYKDDPDLYGEWHTTNPIEYKAFQEAVKRKLEADKLAGELLHVSHVIPLFAELIKYNEKVTNNFIALVTRRFDNPEVIEVAEEAAIEHLKGMKKHLITILNEAARTTED